MSQPITVTLTGTTHTFDVNSTSLPMTVTLRSEAAARAIQISTDNGTEYFTPVLDYSSSTELVVIINAPITHVKVTGAIDDNLFIGY